MRHVGLLQDRRGTIELDVYWVRDDVAEQVMGEQIPVSAWLSTEAADEVKGRLFRCLRAFGRGVESEAEDFYRAIETERIVYGKRRGELFELHFERQNAYSDAYVRIRDDFAPVLRRRKQQRLDELLKAMDRSG